MLSPLKAIRKHCIECHGNQKHMVPDCPDLECHLYPYRMGKNPNRKGIGRKGGSPSIRDVQKLSHLNKDVPASTGSAEFEEKI